MRTLKLKIKKKTVAVLALALLLSATGCGDEENAADVSEISKVVIDSGTQNSTENKTADNGEDSESKAADSGASAGGIADMGADDSWKELYADFLRNQMNSLVGEYDTDWKDSWTFGFIYLNDDEIPELVISSGYEAAGNVICTVAGGKVNYMQTSRLNFYYKESGNLLDNSDGNMGYYHDLVYAIGESGFELKQSGFYTIEYDASGNEETTYELNDRTVTKEEYQKTMDALIPVKERIFWNSGCSYESMMNYLTGNTAKNYKEAYAKVIREGVSDGTSTMNAFALIQRKDAAPLLLCVGEEKFLFCAYEDGLFQKGPSWYFSETEMVLVYPDLGIVENGQYGEDNQSSDSFYRMKEGSLLSEYAYSNPVCDENWEPIKDADGNVITVYTVNMAEVPAEEYRRFVSRYDDVFKQELVKSNAEYTFITYYDAEKMLGMLSD